MDIIVVVCVCFQILLINAPRISATQFRCFGNGCTLVDVSTANDFLRLRNISEKTHFISVENVRMKHLDTSTFNHTLHTVQAITVRKSDALSALTICAAATQFQLNFRSTGIKEIYFEKNCQQQTLTVEHSKLAAIPPTIYRATALTTIEMSSSGIRSVDMELFCNLSLLKKLDLTANKIRSVVNTSPKRCALYDSLEEWNMSQNLLKTISMTLFRPFATLRVLLLKKNLIRLFAGCFASDMLQKLDLSHNMLKAFSLCQWRIPFLVELSLNGNQLSTVPSCLDNLKTLTTVDLDDNQLTDVDFIDMAWMDNLKKLHLSGNKIRSVTLNSSDFPMKLRDLCLKQNNITELRLFVVPGVPLEVDAQDNQIASFDIIGTSPKISELNMLGNPMDCSWSDPEERKNSHCYRKT